MRIAQNRICFVVFKDNSVSAMDIHTDTGLKCTVDGTGSDDDLQSLEPIGSDGLTRFQISPAANFHSDDPRAGHNGYRARAGKAGDFTPGIRSIVSGFGQMVKDRVAKRWSCNLLTFMFNPMVGSEANLLVRMADQVARVYSTFITRTHSRPRSTPLDQLPLFIGCADLPVYKRDRSLSRVAGHKGGLHYHGLLLVPRDSRLRTSVTQHFEDNQGIYLGSAGHLQRLHSKEVTTEHVYTLEYVFKNVLKGRLAYDQAVFILPRTASEQGQ